MLAAALLSLLSAPPARADEPSTTTADWLRTGGAVLDLQVAPPTARVELDGDRLHPGPALVTAGIHLLVVRATGRRELREVVRVTAGRHTKRRVELASLPVTGQLDLRTTPRHARVLVDGRLVGWSPRLMTLSAGRHRLQFLATGYRPTQRLLRVPRGATLTLRVDMTPERGRRHRRARVAMTPVSATVPAWPSPSSRLLVGPIGFAPSSPTSTSASSPTF